MGLRKSGYIRNISTLFMLVVAGIFVFTSGCTHAPIAAFEAKPTQGGPAPMTVTFTDKSTGSGITSKVWQYKLNSDNPLDTYLSDSYEWTTFSLDRYSSYNFEKAGSYDIKLIVTGKGGSDEIIKPKYINIGCDFSKREGSEICFGGIGSNCDGVAIFAPVKKNEDTCKVDGWISAGSILHDKCCLDTNNKGWFCPGPYQGDPNLCNQQWDEARSNTLNSIGNIISPRQWEHAFGPYPLGNTGDKIPNNFPANELKAPSGTHINPEYQDLCQSGKCIEEDGKIKQSIDTSGWYCICQ